MTFLHWTTVEHASSIQRTVKSCLSPHDRHESPTQHGETPRRAPRHLTRWLRRARTCRTLSHPRIYLNPSRWRPAGFALCVRPGSRRARRDGSWPSYKLCTPCQHWSSLNPDPQVSSLSLLRSSLQKLILCFQFRYTVYTVPHATMVLTTGVVLRAAAGVAVSAACAYLFWPVAAPVAMMKAPGAAGLHISRAAFLANPQLCFELLRNAGVQAAVAAFAA